VDRDALQPEMHCGQRCIAASHSLHRKDLVRAMIAAWDGSPVGLDG